MTIQEMIEILQEMADEHGEDTEVIMGYQENWPLCSHILGISDNQEPGKKKKFEVVIVEGSQIGYGLDKWWNEYQS